MFQSSTSTGLCRAAQAAHHGRVRRMWTALALLAGASTLSVLGSLLIGMPLSPASGMDRAALASVTPVLVPAPAASATVNQPRATPTLRQLVPVIQLRLTLFDGFFLIEAHGVTRQDLIQRLAQMTQAELHIAPGAMADATRLDLRWQGSDMAAAWQLLLGAAQPHAVQCDGMRCRVWVLPSLAERAREPGGPNGAPEPATFTPPLQPDPPGLFPSE